MKRQNGMSLQSNTSLVWDQYYLDYEEGSAVGIEYPTEALVRFVSNLRKSHNASEYFNDKGNERSVKTNLSGRALELGFGSVANLQMIAKKGYEEVKGLEVSNEAVLRGRKRIDELGLSHQIRLSRWTPIDLPYDDNYFDFIYGLQCIYYNLEIEKLVSEIYRVMKPGGHFLFSFFSTNHGYMEMLEEVEPGIYRWADNHKNQRLVGASFRQPKSKEELSSWFGAFNDLNIFTYEFDQLPVFQSWWYANGKKSL